VYYAQNNVSIFYASLLGGQGMRLTNSHLWLTWYLYSGQWLHQRYCSRSTKFHQGSRTGKI